MSGKLQAYSAIGQLQGAVRLQKTMLDDPARQSIGGSGAADPDDVPRRSFSAAIRLYSRRRNRE